MKGCNIKCIVLGEERYFSPVSLWPKIKKFGGLQDFKKYYICPKAKRELKSGKTVNDIRKEFNAKVTKKVHPKILAKLGLLKKQKKRGTKKTQWIDNQIPQVSTTTESTRWGSDQEYIEEMTGGPNGCQIHNGGTCHRPDIYYNYDKQCNICPYYKYCLCINKNEK